jgi:pyruvate dehydrogenase E2 component (dihydrolipoamide acetyltransferase)
MEGGGGYLNVNLHQAPDGADLFVGRPGLSERRGMGTEIKMPQLGETVVEGTITKWLKQEGDTVQADEYIVEISTDKVDSEVPSSAAGVIQKILVQEGETVKVGTAIAVVGEDGEAAAEPQADQEQAESQAAGDQAAGAQAESDQEQSAAQESSPEEKEPAAQEGPTARREEEPAPEPEKEEPAPDGSAESTVSDEEKKEMREAKKEPWVEEQTPRPQEDAGPAADREDSSKRGIISPLVRRLAEENDVNLDEVSGTGTGGRIRKQDVLRFVEEKKARPAPAAAQPAPAATGGAQPPREETAQEEREAAPATEREELVPWTNIRRRTAEHMVASHLETARAWNAVEADWTHVVALRERAKSAFREREGFNLTYLPFLARAVCETLLDMPEVNASYDEENQGNRVKHYVNLGIAVALEGGGLIVPVVKGADEKNLVGLARGINDVVTRTRSKKLSPDDLAGGTFTITNPGPFGSILSVPIIPTGQTAILGFEAIEKRVVVTEDDAIAIRSMGFLSLSWDHRTIDGAEAARFLASLRERIEATDFSPDLAQYI